MNFHFCVLGILLLLTACSAKKPPQVPLTLTVETKSLLSSQLGGVYIYGSSADSNDSFAFALGSEGPRVSLELSAGTWKFAAIGWAGPNPLEGAQKCDFQQFLVSGEGANITLNLNTAACGLPHFGDVDFNDGSNQFQQFKLDTCLHLTGVAPAAACAQELRGETRSFQVVFPAYRDLAQTGFQVLPQKIISSCQNMPAYPSSILVTPIKIPIGSWTQDFLPITVLNLYTQSACAGEAQEMYFYDGIAYGSPAPYVESQLDDDGGTVTKLHVRHSFLDYDFMGEMGFYSYDGPGAGNDSIRGTVSDDEGNIYAVGHVTDGGAASRLAIWKFLADGTLDPSFNSATNPFIESGEFPSSTSSAGNEIDLDEDDNLVIVGLAYASGVNTAAIMRMDTDGVLDATFGSGGVVMIANGANPIEFFDFDFEDNGAGYYIHAVGTKDLGANYNMFYVKYDDTGTPVYNFNRDSDGGISGTEMARSVIYRDGYVYAVGYGQNTGPNFDMLLWKYDAGTGTMVASWPKTYAQTGYSGEDSLATANQLGLKAVMDDYDRLVVSGYTTVSTGKLKSVLWRIDSATGTLDSTFGTGGITARHDFCSSFNVSDQDSATALEIDDYDRILVGGQCGYFNASAWVDSLIYIKRYSASGVLDTGFLNGVHLFGPVVSRAADMDDAKVLNTFLRADDGGLFMGGFQVPDSANTDAVLIKLSDPDYL